ncbi:hypothetical protein QE152_g10052 [Popillia japonica]|uniref:Uncharacterized protein n=1 Tax=Popillia japonica TaxID=7064 RepID=A0AAW1LW13_POPJA
MAVPSLDHPHLPPQGQPGRASEPTAEERILDPNPGPTRANHPTDREGPRKRATLQRASLRPTRRPNAHSTTERRYAQPDAPMPIQLLIIIIIIIIVGDQVMVKAHPLPGQHFSPKWMGPYPVVELAGPTAVWVERPGAQRAKYHLDQVQLAGPTAVWVEPPGAQRAKYHLDQLGPQLANTEPQGSPYNRDFRGRGPDVTTVIGDPDGKLANTEPQGSPYNRDFRGRGPDVTTVIGDPDGIKSPCKDTRKPHPHQWRIPNHQQEEPARRPRDL